MASEELYDRREQTLIKHLILGRYLERFAHIVGHKWPSITYVDCFAGPWKVKSDQLEDSSFAIALRELRKARDTVAQKRGKVLKLRGLFLEKDRSAFDRLKGFADRVTDVELKVLNQEFEESVPEIRSFIQDDRDTFPFSFIDPTGWTGFRLELIKPLLQLRQGEVLINFMTEHIRRFLSHQPSQQSFIDLFGSDRVVEKVEGLSGIERDDVILGEYMDAVRSVGKFQHVLAATVLHPEKDRPHFHLIYGTRHPRGVEVFKEAEEKAMETMLQVRSDALLRRERERTGQGSLFALFGEPLPASSRYYDKLRQRYLERSKKRVLDLLESRQRVPYDELWALALSSSLVWERDLKEWIGSWRKNGTIVLEGLQDRQKVPRQGKGHTLVKR